MGKWQQQHCRVVNKLSLEEEVSLMQAVVLPFLLLLQVPLSLELLFLLSLHLGSLLLLLLQAGLARSEALVVQSLVNPSFNQSVTKNTHQKGMSMIAGFFCVFSSKSEKKREKTKKGGERKGKKSILCDFQAHSKHSKHEEHTTPKLLVL